MDHVHEQKDRRSLLASWHDSDPPQKPYIILLALAHPWLRGTARSSSCFVVFQSRDVVCILYINNLGNRVRGRARIFMNLLHGYWNVLTQDNRYMWRWRWRWIFGLLRPTLIISKLHVGLLNV